VRIRFENIRYSFKHIVRFRELFEAPTYHSHDECDRMVSSLLHEGNQHVLSKRRLGSIRRQSTTSQGMLRCHFFINTFEFCAKSYW
jgi:hypothetical protein